MAKLIVAFRNFAKVPKKLPPPRERERADSTVFLQQAAWRQARASLRRKRRSGRMTIITHKEIGDF